MGRQVKASPGSGAAGAAGTDGADGAPGVPAFPGRDGDDGFFIPGTPGTTGADGASGAAGRDGAPAMPAEDGADGMFVPGKDGAAGTAGSDGAAGAAGQPIPGMAGEDGDQGFFVPPLPPDGVGIDFDQANTGGTLDISASSAVEVVSSAAGDASILLQATGAAADIDIQAVGSGAAKVNLYGQGVTALTVDGNLDLSATGATADVNITSEDDVSVLATDGISLETDAAGFGVLVQTAPTGKVGFFGVTPVVRPTVSGNRGDGSALSDLITDLGELGIISDSSVSGTSPVPSPGFQGEDGDSPMFLPGERGTQGTAGSDGAAGAAGASIPGPAGEDGDFMMGPIFSEITKLQGFPGGSTFLRGDGVFATPAGAPPAGTTVEADMGTTPTWRGKFTITDAGIASTSKVMCWQAPGPYTGKGSALSADEGTLDPIIVTAVIPATGSAVVHWETKGYYAPVMLRDSNNASGPSRGQTEQAEAAGLGFQGRAGESSFRQADIVGMQRLGKVKGNIKFSYVTFA